MTTIRRRLLLAIGVSYAAACAAHEGEEHRAAPVSLPPAVLAQQPHRLLDGSLYVSKDVQHLLGIRTRLRDAAAPAREVVLWAEVQAQPAAALTIAAPGPGRLEPADRPWPLPGQSVRAGEVVAWLRPQIVQRERARRRARVDEIDQKLVIADINVERLSLQDAVNGERKSATGNIYYEQAKADRDALRRERGLLAHSLEDRVPLRAEVSGRVLSAPLRVGDVVASGQVLFRLADPAQQRLVAQGFDPELGRQVRTARAGGIALAYRGQEPLADAPGWRLLFDPVAGQTPPDWSPGQPVELQLGVQGGGADADACVPAGEGGAQLWLHAAPERFVALRRASCAEAVAALSPGDRLVTQGAALLAQYR